MTLNFNQVGKPVAMIKGGKYDKKLIYINPDLNDHDATDFKHLKIANESNFQQVPDTTTERQILYITGPSGSGKSTYTRMFLEEYKRKYKDREIYLFSSLKEDESLDKIKPKRFKIDDSLWKDPLNAEELKESVCIFDDIDVITDKKIKEAVYKIMDNVWRLAGILRSRRSSQTIYRPTGSLPDASSTRLTAISSFPIPQAVRYATYYRSIWT